MQTRASFSVRRPRPSRRGRLLAGLAVCGLLFTGCAPAVVRANVTGRPPVAGAAGGERAAARVTERGMASWYGPGFAGRRTANGEVFDPSQLTAAHKELPFNTLVRVTNEDNGRSVVVRIN